MIVKMPDGTNVDMGDHPSQDAINHVHEAAAAQMKNQSTTSTPTTSTTTTTTPTTGGGGEAQAATTTPQPEKPSSGWTPTIARTAGPIVGGAIGLLGGPAGAMAGAAAGGAVGDIIAQRAEIHAGERKDYNPLRTVAEMGTDVAFAGIPMGDALITAVAKSGTIGAISSNAISISEGQGFNSAGQDAVAFLTTGALVGGIHGTASYLGARSAAIKEASGVPQVEEHVNVLTAPDAPLHGPDGAPTEVPPPSPLVDEFGKPIASKGPPATPEAVGPPDPASAIQVAPTTGGGEPKVGQTPVSKKTGLTVASQKMQKKQAVLDTFLEQRRPGIFEAQPVKDIPPLEQVTEPLLEKDGGMEALQKQADDPIQDIPGNNTFDDRSKMTQGVMDSLGRTRGYFQRLEEKTGYPVYQDYYKLADADRAYQGAKKQMSGIAGKALKGTDRGDWNAMIQDMAAGADGQTLRPKLRAKLDSLTTVADKALSPFDITAHDLFTEYIPAMLANDQDTLASDKWAKFQDTMIKGGINLNTTDVPRMMQQVVNMGAFEEHAGPVVSYLKNKYSASLDAPESVKQAINFYTGVLDGTPDRIVQSVGGTLTNAAAKFGWTLDGEGFARRLVSSQYSAALAGRPGPIIRRLLHPMQTAVGPMGFSWVAEGYRQMLTSAGRSAVEQSGIAADSIMNELAMSGKTRLGRMVDRTVGTLMTPFGSADLYSRGPVYLGQRAKILWAAEKYGDDVDKFLTKSGVGRYSQQDANIVLDKLTRGDAEGAANAGAEMMDANTQFKYSQLERPRVLTGSGGSLGGFGVWPMQYGEYIGRMFNRGANGTWFQVGRDFSRYLAANSAIVGGFYGAAKFVNDQAQLNETFGWSFISHIAYTGSPLLSSLYSGAQQLKQTIEGRPPKLKDVWRNDVAPNIPMSGLGSDVYRASQEPDLGSGIAYFTGIDRPKKSTGGVRGVRGVQAVRRR